MKKRSLLTALVLCLGAPWGAAQTQAWPAKPIRILVGVTTATVLNVNPNEAPDPTACRF